ncbi:MAG: LacI family DNA-binding transcriptional regulator [Terracidiphilus sp.]
MRVRLKDIAEDLNLSKMTISKVLRGQTDISDETKARVLKRVKELKYIPNISASSLRTGQTKTIGLVLPSIGSPFLSQIVGAVNEAVSAESYGLIVASSQQDADFEQRQIEIFLSLQVDALLVISLQETGTFFEQMQKSRRMPVIFVDQRPPGTTENFVGIHDEEVGRIACDHLVNSGCKRIAYLRGPRTAAGDMRAKGYREALSDHSLPIQPDLVVESMHPEESEYKRGYDSLMRLLGRRGRPDGVMTYTDMMAIGAMDAAAANGIRIPDEMRFVGCGDDALLCAMKIPLTSINIGGHELGAKAAQLALRAIGIGDRKSAHRILVKPKLVKRRSSEKQR